MANQTQKQTPGSDLDRGSRRDSSTGDFSPTSEKRPRDMGTGKDLKDTPERSPSDRKEQSSTKW